jgi:hypothetical protein
MGSIGIGKRMGHHHPNEEGKIATRKGERKKE